VWGLVKFLGRGEPCEGLGLNQTLWGLVKVGSFVHCRERQRRRKRRCRKRLVGGSAPKEEKWGGGSGDNQGRHVTCRTQKSEQTQQMKGPASHEKKACARKRTCHAKIDQPVNKNPKTRTAPRVVNARTQGIQRQSYEHQTKKRNGTKGWYFRRFDGKGIVVLGGT